MSYVIDEKMFTNFLLFVLERERTRLNKAAGGPPPWTDDPIIRDWRFCNVNRNDDRVTRWIYEYITRFAIDSQHDEDREVLWFNLAVARFINWPPTLAQIGYLLDWNKYHGRTRFMEVMDSRMARKEQCYTGAYMIRAGTGEDAKLTKHAYLDKRVFTPLWKRKDERPGKKAKCADWDAFFAKTFGMGDFMRNQIITDMKYTADLSEAEDWGTFCLAGPGTKRGLNRLGKQELAINWNPEHSNQVLQDVRALVLVALKGTSSELADNIKHAFKDLNNVSNCFCEWDKYRRVTEGQGQPRSRYRPDPDPLPGRAIR